jgi:hypothetical protein
MKNILFVIAGCLAISACATQAHQETQKKAAFQTAVAQCRAPFPAKVGNYVARARCFIDTDAQFYPNDSFAPVMNALWVNLATKVDHGEMSPQDMELQLQQTLFTLNQEQARTNAAVNAAQANTLLGAAAILNATKPPPVVFPTPSLPVLSLPVLTPSLPVTHQTNCSVVGPSISCTGN